jgi:hypothetical protein
MLPSCHDTPVPELIISNVITLALCCIA